MGVNSKDFFFHQRDQQGPGKIYVGAKVSFLLDERSLTSGKPHAIRVRMVDPSMKPPPGAQTWGTNVNASVPPRNGDWQRPAQSGSGEEWSDSSSSNKDWNPMEMMDWFMDVMKGQLKGKGKGKGKDKGKGKSKADWPQSKGEWPQSNGEWPQKGAPDWGQTGWHVVGKGSSEWQASSEWQGGSSEWQDQGPVKRKY